MKKQITEKGVSDNKVTVIYNGIKTQIPYKERIPNKTYQLAVVGRMTEEKGHAYLLNSLAQLNDMHPNLEWVCHFYGEGLLQEDLKQQSNSLGLQERIVFHGFESDQEKVYGNTDVVIVPSENDALPYVAIESLAYGIPVIGTNVGGVPEIVSNNETGYIVEYGDTKSMGEKIASIIQNQMIYSQFSINARKRYEQLFSQQKMIDEVKKIYQY